MIHCKALYMITYWCKNYRLQKYESTEECLSVFHGSICLWHVFGVTFWQCLNIGPFPHSEQGCQCFFHAGLLLPRAGVLLCRCWGSMGQRYRAAPSAYASRPQSSGTLGDLLLPVVLKMCLAPRGGKGRRLWHGWECNTHVRWDLNIMLLDSEAEHLKANICIPNYQTNWNL